VQSGIGAWSTCKQLSRSQAGCDMYSQAAALGEAIEQVDAETGASPGYYMINSASGAF
jgi:hypothetical protein